MDEIVNRVSKSALEEIDLEDYFPNAEIVGLDIKEWLFHGLILKEKEFREKLESFDWEQFRDKKAAVYCSTDAIIPYWAYMLLAARLEPIAREVIYATPAQVTENEFIRQIRQSVNPLNFEGKRVVIKGCGEKYIPPSAYMEVTRLLRPHVKSIMYGEPCSTVPVYKQART
jgi:hypothetical protein